MIQQLELEKRFNKIIDCATHLSPSRKQELKTHVMFFAFEMLNDPKYKFVTDIHLCNIFKKLILPHGEYFKVAFGKAANKTVSLCNENGEENGFYLEDKTEPLPAEKPTIEDCKIDVGDSLDFYIWESVINASVKKIPDDINDDTLKKFLVDLSTARLDHPVPDPDHLVQLLIVDKTYKNLTDLLKNNKHLSAKKVRRNYKRLKTELVRWYWLQFEKYRSDEIIRRGKSKPLTGESHK